MKYTILTILILGLLSACKIEGCTDPEAANFNPHAKTDDGTCLEQKQLVFGGGGSCSDTEYRWDQATIYDSAGMHYLRFDVDNSNNYLLLEFPEPLQSKRYYHPEYVFGDEPLITNIIWQINSKQYVMESDYFEIDLYLNDGKEYFSACNLQLRDGWQSTYIQGVTTSIN